MKVVFNKKYILLFLVLVSWVGFYYFSKSKSKDQSAGFGKVVKQDLLQRVSLSGNVTPAHKALIIPPYSGYLKKLFVNVGDEVKVDAPLVSVVQSLSRFEEVYPLRSPIKGRVVQIRKLEGEYVKTGDSADFIMRIDDLSEMFINVNAAEIDRVKILPNQEAIVKPLSMPQKEYKAIVTELSLAANDKDRWDRSTVVEFPVVLRVTNPDEDLKSGMSALVEIITDRRPQVLTLRHEYIFSDENKNFVLLKNGQRKEIQVGQSNEEMQEVVSGLSEGELVQKVDFSKLMEK